MKQKKQRKSIVFGVVKKTCRQLSGVPMHGRVWIGLLLSCAAIISEAATDLADSPVPVALNSAKVQPNIMFTLDDSGSMHFEVLPEERIVNNSYYMFPRASSIYGGDDYANSVVGFDDTLAVARLRSNTVNKLYYSPAIRYRPWSNQDGTEMANAVPNKAYHNPYKTTAGYRNLEVDNAETAYWPGNSGLPASKPFYPALYYRYKGGDINALTSYQRIEIKKGNAPFVGGGDRTDCANPLACTYEEEIQNFANWYTYYRSRILAARASIGRAFSQLNHDVRVGFGAINKGPATIEGSASPGTIITSVKQFTGAHRSSWFESLYGHVIPAAGTPLRRALDDVGQYFSRTDDSGPWGPAPQYVCRQSYNILMTDGYWSSGSNNEARTSAARENVDNKNGPVISKPGGGTYQYVPEPANDKFHYEDSASNTLADVAMYYWNRDLRPDLSNEVPTNSKDPAFWQHLVNFTVGLGVAGTTHAEGVWPDNVDTDAEKVDDLEHAGINSRGGFFRADNPETFANNLIEALNDIAGRNNAFTATAVSNPNISAADNVTFGTSYNPADWSGEISAYSLNPVDGSISATSNWNPGAQALLDARTTKTSDKRLIATYNGSAGTPFQWGNLTADQKMSLSDESVLRFLRGWRDKEGDVFRKRQHILGDIVNAEGVVVSPGVDYHYTDPGYSDFAGSAEIASRAKTLYQGANDGMLHAIDAVTGEERWAYVPSLLMSTLKDLSLKTGFSHKYYVDATPVLADVDFKNTEGGGGPVNWRTILVGGLGKGGRGYYALDVTSPLAANETAVASKVLWEFTDPDMGYSYGKPVIVKTRAKKWVVLLTSGYNNVPAANGGPPGSTTGDGKGHLYVLNAKTGQLLRKIDLPDSGSLAKPSGFAHITGLVEDTDQDNTVELVFGGDLNGDVWRIDLSDSSEANWNVSKFATLANAPGEPQPVTTVPETACVAKCEVAGARMVYIGTGKYLGISDVSTAQVQSMYGLKDGGKLARVNNGTAAPAPVINVRGGTLVEQTMSTSGTTRYASHKEVNLGSKNGWFLDLPASKERINADPQLAYGVLVFTSNIPDDSPCSIYGGSSWINYLDYRTGGAVKISEGTYASASKFLGQTLSSRPVIVVAGGKPYAIGTKTDDSRFKEDIPMPGSSKRVSWREIVGD